MGSTILPDPTATLAYGRVIAEEMRPGSILALCGDLGAGKTHFVKGLAAGLGVPAEVVSPTFALVHEHFGGRLPLYHFDLYRLENEDEVWRIGLEEYLEAGGVMAVEWADKFPALWPAETRWLRFVHRADGQREAIE